MLIKYLQGVSLAYCLMKINFNHKNELLPFISPFTFTMTPALSENQKIVKLKAGNRHFSFNSLEQLYSIASQQ